MKPWLIGTLVLALVAAGMPDPADAKRLGGSRSSGMQRAMPERTAPQTPATPATPAQQAAPSAAAAAPAAAGTAAAGTAAAAGKRSWMGPIAGLAAGLGLAALMSHLGLGEAFANFLMMALLGVAVVALVFFLMRRFGGGAGRGGLATAGAGAGGAAPSSNPWAAQPMARTPLPQAAPVATPMPSAQPLPAAGPAAGAPLAPAFVPASFDSEGFARVAKAIFIRLQAANDAGDMDDLRRFTTPEMFAEIKLDLQDRQGAAQHTDVVAVDAEVLDVASEADRQVVSVRYRGRIAEAEGAAPEDFDEIWHLVKPHGNAGSWVIAGIEQSR